MWGPLAQGTGASCVRRQDVCGAPGSGHGGLLREEAGSLGAPLAQCTGAFDPQGPHLSEPLPASTSTPP